MNRIIFYRLVQRRNLKLQSRAVLSIRSSDTCMSNPPQPGDIEFCRLTFELLPQYTKTERKAGPRSAATFYRAVVKESYRNSLIANNIPPLQIHSSYSSSLMSIDTTRSKGSLNDGYVESDTSPHTLMKQDTERSDQRTAKHDRIPKSNPLVGVLTISALMLPITIVPFLALRRRLVRMEQALEKMACAYEASIRDEAQRVRTIQDSHRQWLQDLDKQLATLASENKSNNKDLIRDLSGITSRLNENG